MKSRTRPPKYLLVLCLLVLAAVACTMESGTATPTRPPPDTAEPTPSATVETPLSTATETLTETPVPTASVTPTSTATPTATHTPLPPTPTRIVADTATPRPTPEIGSVEIPDTLPNRLANPGFEGDVRSVTFNEINVFEGWQPFYCDEPYTPDKCPALRHGEGNPDDLLMGRPEYKPTEADDRVHSGETAQQWFCFFRTCIAGVYQTFDTIPGEICEVGAHIQSWSNYDNGDEDGDGKPESDLDTPDERDNSAWFILVDQTGGTFAFADHNIPTLKGDEEGELLSPPFDFEDDIYDQYVDISMQFVAMSSQTTVFFGDRRLWPYGNNDSYIDDAYARCINPEEIPLGFAGLGQGGGGEIVTENTQEEGETIMLQGILQSDLLVEIIIGTIALAFLIVKVIEELKKRGKIEDGAAGEWATNLSAGLSLILGMIQTLVSGSVVQGAEAWANDAAGVIVFALVLILNSKLLYEFLKWTGGAQSLSRNDVTPPRDLGPKDLVGPGAGRPGTA